MFVKALLPRKLSLLHPPILCKRHLFCTNFFLYEIPTNITINSCSLQSTLPGVKQWNLRNLHHIIFSFLNILPDLIYQEKTEEKTHYSYVHRNFHHSQNRFYGGTWRVKFLRSARPAMQNAVRLTSVRMQVMRSWVQPLSPLLPCGLMLPVI